MSRDHATRKKGCRDRYHDRVSSFVQGANPMPFRKSRRLHSQPAAAAAAPRSFLAPSLRFGPNRSRIRANASSTNPRLPMTTPSREIPHPAPHHLAQRHLPAPLQPIPFRSATARSIPFLTRLAPAPPSPAAIAVVFSSPFSNNSSR